MFLKSIPSNSGRELHELVRSYFIHFEWKFDPDNLITKITVDTAWSCKRRFSYFLTSVDFISARRRPVISLQAWHIQVTFFLSDHVLNLLPTTILNNLTILPEYLTDLNGKKIQEKFSNFSNVNLIIHSPHGTCRGKIGEVLCRTKTVKFNSIRIFKSEVQINHRTSLKPNLIQSNLDRPKLKKCMSVESDAISIAC